MFHRHSGSVQQYEYLISCCAHVGDFLALVARVPPPPQQPINGVLPLPQQGIKIGYTPYLNRLSTEYTPYLGSC